MLQNMSDIFLFVCVPMQQVFVLNRGNSYFPYTTFCFISHVKVYDISLEMVWIFSLQDRSGSWLFISHFSIKTKQLIKTKASKFTNFLAWLKYEKINKKGDFSIQ